jgi:hypothetical protein
MSLRLQSGAVMWLVLHLVERLDAGLRVHLPDLLALFQKHAVHFHLRADNDGIVVHEPAIADRLLDAIAEHRLTKERNGMGGWRGRKAHADRVEVLEACRARHSRPAGRTSRIAYPTCAFSGCVTGSIRELSAGQRGCLLTMKVESTSDEDSQMPPWHRRARLVAPREELV